MLKYNQPFFVAHNYFSLKGKNVLVSTITLDEQPTLPVFEVHVFAIKLEALATPAIIFYLLTI